MTFDIKKLAYCGLYCDQCSSKVAFEEQNLKHFDALPRPLSRHRELVECDCEGCKGNNICGPCKIKECASPRDIDSCAQCQEFPCETITAFANDGWPHHLWALENLKAIREHGVERWFETLNPPLHCHCGARQSWYYLCPEHG